MRVLSNLICTAIGLWLSYAAVLDISGLQSSAWVAYVAGVVVLGLSFWTRTRDFARWPGMTNIVAAIVAILGVALFHGGFLNNTVAFWAIFFSGNVISVLALWAAIYRGGVVSRPHSGVATQEIKSL
ncbi:membrane hypothetical protein [Thiomonas sp. X19]|nr:membrane hypothetical protein [Thiomonas sp. X19]